MNFQPTVYLAGKMPDPASSSDEDLIGEQIVASWRAQIIKRVWKYNFLFPETGKDHKCDFHVALDDMELIQKSEILVAYVDCKDRVGTFCEIASARAYGLNVYLFYTANSELPWFVKELSYKSFECKDEKDVIEKIINHLGGDSVDYYEYIKSEKWKAIADMAKDRADGKCQICNSPENLNTHHRTYERLGKELDGDLIVLCQKCHKLFEENKKLEKIS